ncbi:hypothetical protein M0802_010745 [Mischocyttarus mexicanus]|nr:hypothetical protein M0802_010745 [Mischocyttarus mexicanus]
MNLTICGLTLISDELRRIVEDYHSITVQKTRCCCYNTLLYCYYNCVVGPPGRTPVTHGRSGDERVKKLQGNKDRMASHVVKLERERRMEEPTAKVLKILHAQLLIDFSILLDKRLEYIKPSVHALIMIQLNYYGNTTGLFTQLIPVHNPFESSSAVIPEEEYQQLINSQINRIRGLRIVKDQ